MRRAKSGMDERRAKILDHVSIQTKETGEAAAAKSKHIMNESYHRVYFMKTEVPFQKKFEKVRPFRHQDLLGWCDAGE